LKQDTGLHNLDTNTFNEIIEKFPGKKTPNLALVLVTIEILTQAFGPDFVRRHYNICKNLDALDEILSTKTRFLAILIWELRKCRNFSEYLNSCKNRKDITSILHELFVARGFWEISSDIEFINADVSAQKNCDLIAFDSQLSSEDLFIEIKTRETPFKDKNTFFNFLNKAKKQIPKEKSGLIAISIIPGNSGEMHLSEQAAEETIFEFLDKKSRVKHVFIYRFYYTNHFSGTLNEPKKKLGESITLVRQLFSEDEKKDERLLINLPTIPSYMANVKY